MNKNYLLGAALLLIGYNSAQAQSKIKDGSITATSSLPGANSILELESNKRGLLMPRIALTATTSASPLSAHVAGMTVYNTATSGAGATAVTPGYYYNDGAKWLRIADATVAANNWSLSGNAGTSSSINFIGTTDNASFVTRTNNIERSRITANGNLLINTLNDSLDGIGQGGKIVLQKSAQNRSIIDYIGPFTTNRYYLDTTAASQAMYEFLNPSDSSYQFISKFVGSSRPILTMMVNDRPATNKGFLGVGGQLPSFRPTNQLHVSAVADPLRLEGLQPTSTATDSVIMVDGAGVLKYKSAASLGEAEFWKLKGNTGTSDTNFVGTTDAVKLRFRTKNANRMVIDTLGKVLVNTDSVLKVTGLTSQMQVAHSGSNWGLTIRRNANDNGNPNLTLFKTRGDGYVPARAGDGAGRLTWHAATNSTGATAQLGQIQGQVMSIDTTNNKAAFSMQFAVANQTLGAFEAMRLDSTGNLGIGTATPASKLEVIGAGNFRTGYTASNYGVLVQSNDSGAYGEMFAYQAGVGPANLILNKTGGNVGIGLINPTRNLEILGGGTVLQGIHTNSAVNSGRTVIQLGRRMMTGASSYGHINGWDISSNVNFNNDEFSIRELDSATGTAPTRMTILKGGNFGIGTASPTSKLHVNGTVRIDTLTGGAASDSIVTADATGVLRKRSAASISADSEPWYKIGTTVGATSNTDSVYIMGRVGIGTNTPSHKLHLKDPFPYLAFEDTEDPNGSIGTITAYQNGGMFYDANRYLSATPGSHIFRVGSGGSLNTAVLIDSAGKVGIGTITPTVKLDIYGATGNVLTKVKSGDSTAYMGDVYQNVNGGQFFIGIGGGAVANPLHKNTGILQAQSTSSAIRLEAVNNVNFGPHSSANTVEYIDMVNGRVGIGTTSPTNKLHVNGQVRIDTLAAGAVSDSIVTADATGVLRKRSLAALAGSGMSANALQYTITATDVTNGYATVTLSGIAGYSATAKLLVTIETDNATAIAVDRTNRTATTARIKFGSATTGDKLNILVIP